MKPTIVYLHGLNCSSKIFSFLHAQLPDHNPHFIDYVSNQPLEDSYRFIVNQLPSKPFMLVGHSLGGVLGYLIATRTRLPLKKLVTISSPFGGSSTASLLRWFYPQFKILKDIASTSKIMKEISITTPKVPFLSLVSVAGSLPFMGDRNDGVVTYESQTCVQATERIELESNHFEAVQDMNGVVAIKEFLF
jgi:pimeloyl-ACP methyl ester carboxylesterase